MRDTDLVFAGDLGELVQYFLNLGREYVDTFDLHHVICAALDDIDAGPAASAGALLGNDPGEVVSPVTDQGSALLDQGRDDDLAPLSVRKRLEGNGINDLQIEIIIPVVHVLALAAVDADAGAVDFGQAIDIIELDSQDTADTFAHGLAPALASDDALFEHDLVPDTALFNLLCQKKGIGGCGAEDGGLHVLHHLDLLVGISGAHRDGHGAQLLTAVLEADAGSPQTIAGRDLDAVFVGDARHFVAALEHLAPVIDVLGGVRNNDGKACCA